MSEILELIRGRRSLRVPFDLARPVAKEDLASILEAARWSPSAHNMQNFEIVVVDDTRVLEALARVERPVSETFIRENYEQLSFSEEELLERKAGLLATMFPSAWRTPGFKLDAMQEDGIASRQRALMASPVMLVVLYDPSRRAPASEGDFLGIISLGCVMENMWLAAESMGLGVQIVSSLGSAAEVKRILGIREDLVIAFSCRLGYPTSKPTEYLRVRRDVEDFTHFNRYDG
jgi:nitroreductase